MIKHDNLSDVLLNDKPEKYKYKPYPTYSEGVLFLVFIKDAEHLQAIDLSLSEQSLQMLNEFLNNTKLG